LIITIEKFDYISGGVMEIRNLISFVHVAELNSFTKAAEALGYSQSTISFQIKQLETELDCLLFERINHTITLTQRGEELLEYAQNISRLTEEFKQNTASDKAIKGSVHVVSPDSICEEMLMSNYSKFNRLYPQINLRFTAADTLDMFEMLDKNEADIMLTLDNHIHRNDYVIAKEKHIDMHFVTNAKSPLLKHRELSIFDIINEPFLLTEHGMGYRRVLDKELAKKSIEISPILEVGRTDIITTLLENGEGISYLPDFVTKEKVKDGKLAYLNITDIQTDIWEQLIYHKNKWVSNCLKAFIEFVTEVEF
jgi:DNA-binding transcriptional LysR family regulator